MSPSAQHLDAEAQAEAALRALEGAGVDHDPVTGRPRTVRAAVLERARHLVDGPRAEEYGPPELSFQRVADGWNWWLRARGRPADLHAEDVGAMLAMLKLSRASQSPAHADSWVDLAGYAACAAEVAGAQVRK